MKVLVTISDSHPELLRELKKMDRRHRAERLRSLAFSGLSSLQKTQGNLEPIKNDGKTQTNHEKESVKQALNQGLANLGRFNT